MPKACGYPNCMKVKRKPRKNKVGIEVSVKSSTNNQSSYNDRRFENMILQRRLKTSSMNKNKSLSIHEKYYDNPNDVLYFKNATESSSICASMEMDENNTPNIITATEVNVRSIEQQEEENKDTDSEVESDNSGESSEVTDYAGIDDEGDESTNETASYNNLYELNDEQISIEIFSSLPRVAEGFDILEAGKGLYSKHKMHKVSLLSQESAKLYPGANEGSKVEFCTQLNNLLIRHHSTQAFENELIELLHRHLEGNFVSIPYEKIMYSETSESVRGYKNNLADYCPAIDPYLTFDACRKGCCVYIGPNSNEYLCPNCKEARYRQCPVCNAAEDQVCRSSRTVIDDRTIRICKKRVAFRVVQYRPVINILKEILSDSNFRKALKFKFDGTFDGATYGDILEGQTWKKHKDEMSHIFQQYITDNNCENVENVSLYLSLIFDGVKLYDRVTVPCWPLGISVQNLPPHLRGKPGIGAFLLSLITTSINSTSTSENSRGVAYFIFRDCFIEELLALGRGVRIRNGEESVFLQCRLLLSVLDGRGLEEFFHYQGANSKTGCALCGIMKGRYSKILSKTLYGESRNLLPYNHELRYFGQSKVCCPINSIDGDVENADVVTTANGVVSCPVKLQRHVYTNRGGKNFDWNILCCLPAKHRPINNLFMFEEGSLTTQGWYHDDFVVKLFEEYAYFAHCDFREYIPELPINHRQFLIFSIEAQRYFNEERKKAGNKRIPFLNEAHKRKDAPKSGLKGICILFLLQYFKLHESVSYDALHVFKNVVLYFLNAMKGKTAVGDSVAAHCKMKGLHPYLWKGRILDQTKSKKKKSKTKVKKILIEDKPTYGPWFISQKRRETFDTSLENLYIPTNESGKYELSRGAFRQTGNLKTIALIRLLINYMDLLVFVCKIDDAYGELLSMLSADACRLFEPVGTAEDLREDTQRVNETVAVMDGMLPESERYFTVHELVHLSGFRKMQGALRNTWTASVERFVGKVADYAKEGGRSFDKTIWTKYLAFEVNVRSHFEEYISENSKDSPYLRLEHNPNTNEDTLVFSDYRYFLCSEAKERWSFLENDENYYLFGSMLMALILEIERQSTTAAHAMRSPLYQLMQLFLCVCERHHLLKYIYVPEEFAKWILKTDLTSQVTLAKKNQSILLFYHQPVDLDGMAETQRVLRSIYISKLKCFHNSFIGGQKFVSRGAEFQEFQRPESVSDEVYPPMQCNTIKKVLKISKGCDSICKVLIHEDLSKSLGDLMKRDYQPRDGKRQGNTPSYGTHIQLMECAASVNCFLRINLSTCPILRAGIPFAAVNAWEITSISNDRIDLVDCDDAISYLPGVRFVPIIQIVPTRIALTCMKANYEVIGQKKMSSDLTKWIVLLDMDRTRRKIQRMMNRKCGPVYDEDSTTDVEGHEV